jgi:hypothetical protein
MPLIGFYPPEREGAPPPPTTHYEVLLPSGRTGCQHLGLKGFSRVVSRVQIGERLALASRVRLARARGIGAVLLPSRPD